MRIGNALFLVLAGCGATALDATDADPTGDADVSHICDHFRQASFAIDITSAFSTAAADFTTVKAGQVISLVFPAPATTSILQPIVSLDQLPPGSWEFKVTIGADLNTTDGTTNLFPQYVLTLAGSDQPPMPSPKLDHYSIETDYGTTKPFSVKLTMSAVALFSGNSAAPTGLVWGNLVGRGWNPGSR